MQNVVFPFPIIEHIDQAKQAIDGIDGFLVADRGNHTIINYLYTHPDMFPPIIDQETAILRECRGIAFDNKTGKVISRPYHKFFNLNEREETLERNISFDFKKDIVLEKLDGSMIRTIITGSNHRTDFRFGTRMGITDISNQAEVYLYNLEKPKQHLFLDFLSFIHWSNCTAIFEWCSNKQRIVIDHPQDKLILTAIRCNQTGNYATYQQLIDHANHYQLDVVRTYHSTTLLSLNINNLTNTEGFVLRTTNGHMYKIKCPWYVLRHQSKDQLSREKNVVLMILEDRIDDILPVLTPSDQQILIEFTKSYNQRINIHLDYCIDCLLKLAKIKHNNDRKDFALNNDVAGWVRPMIFTLWDLPENQLFNTGRKYIINYLKKIHNKREYDAFARVWEFPRWSYTFESDN